MELRRALSLVAGAGLLAGTLAVATPAHAAQTELWVVNAYTYSAGSKSFDFTVCLDGSLLTDSQQTTDLNGPFDVAAGDHDLTIITGSGAPCSDTAEFDGSITVPEGPQSTLMIYWPEASAAPAVSVFADDLSCTDPGTSRIAVRNAALLYDEGVAPLDVTATDPESNPIDLATDVALGTEEVNDVAAGDYTGIEGTPGPIPVDDQTLDEGVVTALYFYGGADGAVGSFTNTADVGVCEEPTTTTTAAPTTTTTAAAIAAVATTPRYTG